MKPYFDKHGERILPGMKIRHNDGEVEEIFECGDNDLGIDATNHNCPHVTREVCYPLSSFNLSEWEVVKEEK